MCAGCERMCESCSPSVGLGAGVVDEGKTALDVGNTAVEEIDEEGLAIAADDEMEDEDGLKATTDEDLIAEDEELTVEDVETVVDIDTTL